jgi:hypothetical protein
VHSSEDDCHDPAAEYRSRAAQRRAAADRYAGRYRALFHARTLTVGVIVGLAWVGEKERLLPVLLILPALACISAIIEKNRAYRAWHAALRALRYYARRLANVEERWAGTGDSGSRFLEDGHPYANDLDIFGPGSLFERLHQDGTPLGESTLAAWLRRPAGAEAVRARQAAVVELRDRLDLHEALAVAGQQVSGHLEAAAIARWVGAAPATSLAGARVLGLGFMILFLAAMLGAGFGLGPGPVLATTALAAGCTWLLHRRLQRVVPVVPLSAAEWRTIALMLTRIGRESFSTAHLRERQAVITSAASSLPRLIRELSIQPAGVLGFPVLASVQVACVLESWRRRHGTTLAHGLAALGELEALSALAAYAFENPADRFADMVADGPCFEATGLGHPLLPARRCVRNDVSLGSNRRLMIVSGSNMSGKSTLLRTIGVNAVLALMGAPVRATRLRIAPAMLGATLRIQDSLLGGRSRFFAEVQRIRDLLELARIEPLVFLLDELFAGTNSQDRREGAEAVLRRLVDAGAIGVVTTHDLALTQLAEVFTPLAANVHFTDQSADGRMTFDYRMRPGVVPCGNALALLRAVGILSESVH